MAYGQSTENGNLQLLQVVWPYLDRIVARFIADGSTLGLFVLLGAFGGVFASRLLVYLADRLFHLNLARPIGGGMMGHKMMEL